MNYSTAAVAYTAIRVLLKTGNPPVLPEDALRSAERELIGMLPPEQVTYLEFSIASIAHEYASRVQSAKYAAVCP